MAIRPSGSREDVKLVQVETEYLSLILKGKPYHHRYNSLKSYRSMDFHDTMNLTVAGEMIHSIKAYDVNKNMLVEDTVLRPVFFENGVYQLIIIPKQNQELIFYHEHPLIRNAISPEDLGEQKILMGNLHFQNEVGLTTFSIFEDSKKLLEVTLEIFPSKLDYRNDYQKLLAEVNDEIYNLAFHFIRKTYLGAKVKLEGHPSRAEFYRLISYHFDSFVESISNIEKQPHHLLRTTHEKARGDQLGKLDSKGRNYLRKRPHLFVEVEKGIPIKDKRLLPVSGLKIKKEITYDTNENRYVKFMMKRLIHKLNDLQQAIKRQNRRFKQEDDIQLLEQIEEMRDRLEKKIKQPFWMRIGKLDRSVMSLVLQMAPNYRDAFQIFLTVSKGLALQGKIYQMSVKDVATLYEYWTFLKMGQILGRHYQLISQDIVNVNRKGLFVTLDANQTSKRVFKHPVTKEEIILTYQKYEGPLPTVNQKPDTMLSIKKNGKGYKYNFVFDAKYRIDYAQEDSFYQKRYDTPGPLEEDINTMHRYRDSIVSKSHDSYEYNSFGAYVLFPWFDEQSYQHHHFYKSIDQVNIGGLPFLPNATSLVERFIQRLIDKNPEEIQKEGILPKGTVDEWSSALTETVFLGLVESTEDYYHFVENRVYTRPLVKLKQGWQHATYIALYVKNGINTKNGVNFYGKIKNVSVKEENVIFEVEVWEKLSQRIKPVQYGIANYILTTLDSLKESKELPELFMKSKEEVSLWRILRRISDRIKTELDDKLVDQASSVTEFRMKDIKITLVRKDRKMILDNGYGENVISIDTLEKNPTAVFREVVNKLL